MVGVRGVEGKGKRENGEGMVGGREKGKRRGREEGMGRGKVGGRGREGKGGGFPNRCSLVPVLGVLGLRMPTVALRP